LARRGSGKGIRSRLEPAASVMSPRWGAEDVSRSLPGPRRLPLSLAGKRTQARRRNHVDRFDCEDRPGASCFSTSRRSPSRRKRARLAGLAIPPKTCGLYGHFISSNHPILSIQAIQSADTLPHYDVYVGPCAFAEEAFWATELMYAE
jgi:hypothetical protein